MGSCSRARRALAVLAAVAGSAAVAVGLWGSGSAGADGGAVGAIDEEITCPDLVPASATFSGSPTPTVKVAVVYESPMTASEARSVMQRAQVVLGSTSRGPGVDLDIVSVVGRSYGATDVDALFGRLHQDFDTFAASSSGPNVVHYLTTRDLTSRALGPSVAGQAWCVGGIRFDEGGFSMSEVSGNVNATLDGRLAAHEVGHLLGAHHHYSECATSVSPGSGAGPCTLMAPVTSLMSDTVSVLNRPIMRGYAADCGSNGSDRARCRSVVP